MKMIHLVRPLTHWPRCHHQCPRLRFTFNHLLNSVPLLVGSPDYSHRSLYDPSFLSTYRTVHFRSRGLKLPDFQLPSNSSESESDTDPEVKKSRNEKKREARRAVRWGMQLASFSPVQIKRILRVASLEEEVFDALMLVKRLGRDVREGKRRQFNYIGRLLREVEPELMDGLILATKDGDLSKFQALAGLETFDAGDDEAELEETGSEEEEVGSSEYIDTATRWFGGLVNKDIHITNEVYSIHGVEFDRQELRKLVRKVQEYPVTSSEENEREANAAARMSAERSLGGFLRTLAKQLVT